jgi:hypothetical protein
LGTLVVVLMGALDVTELMEVLNFNYSLALLIEYASFIQLRISKPNGKRVCTFGELFRVVGLV